MPATRVFEAQERQQRVRAPRSVVTAMRLSAPPARVWEALLYYEQIEEPPPLLLRWLLPVPTGTVGDRSRVGDEAVCTYQRGHLRKRITQLEPERCYSFAVVEQELLPHIQLLGGTYRLAPVSGGCTKLSLETRYQSSRRPGWIWGPVEESVCHAFHRHLLGAMQRVVDGPRAARLPTTKPDLDSPR